MIDNNIKNKAIELWGDGKTLAAISEITGVSVSTLDRWTKNMIVFGERKNRVDKKNEARKLRELGFSALEISEKIKVPKGTVGHWVEDIVLLDEHKERLKEKMKECCREGCLKGSKINKENADKRHQLAFSEGFERSKKDNLFNIICALYWGEGGKTRRCFVFSNSDPSMIKLVSTWLENENYQYNVDVFHHADGTSEETIKNFWASFLNVQKLNIRWKPSKNSKRKMEMGCVHIVVNNALLHSMIMGGIEALKLK